MINQKREHDRIRTDQKFSEMKKIEMNKLNALSAITRQRPVILTRSLIKSVMKMNNLQNKQTGTGPSRRHI